MGWEAVKKGRDGEMGTAHHGDEGNAAGKAHGSQLGSAGEGARRREADPQTTPRPQEGCTHRRRLRAGSCWLQERKTKAVSRGEAGGACSCAEGATGGCQPGPRASPGPWAQGP